MSDTMTAGVVNAGEATFNPGATETETPNPKGTESVASEAQAEENAGAEQSASESGSAENQGSRQRGPSKLDTIRELRSKLRDQRSYWETEMSGIKAQLEELKGSFKSGSQENKPSKTFWEDPEGVLDSRMTSHLSDLEKRMLARIEQRQVVDQETSEWRSETSEATKFIQTQKGITLEDQEDIAEIVRNSPEMQNMRPLQRAKYAMYLWQQDRGITDKSAVKARAATVVGAGGAQNGPKNWTESEMEREINNLPPDPKSWNADQQKRFEYLDAEFKRAYSEGRVKK